MSITPTDAIILFAVGTIGAYFGSFIGLGGGIIFVPALATFFPHLSTANISTLSLTAIFCNSTAGTIQYSLKKLTHYKYALLISSFTIPTAILGPYIKPFFQKDFFYNAFVVLLILSAFSIFIRKTNDKIEQSNKNYFRNFLFFIPISFFAGMVSSVFGVGGGIILMPIFLLLQPFPTHHALGTTHMIIAFTSVSGLISHITQKNLILDYALFLCIGAIIGSKIGVWTATKSKSSTIKYILSLTLILIAISLFIRSK